jgi:hypothetical protein
MKLSSVEEALLTHVKCNIKPSIRKFTNECCARAL